MRRMANLGGGQANRQINVDSSVMSTKYTDLNILAGANITLTKSDDDSLKRTNLTIDADMDGGLTVTSTTASVYSVATTDNYILASSSVQTATIELPTAVGITGRRYDIKKTDPTANVVVVKPDGSETIDDGIAAELHSQYESMTVVSNGVDWVII